MRPMLATPGERVPTGPAWVHELKWDGMRVLADLRGGRARLTTRTERDVSGNFPELAPLADLYDDVLLDGEVVALEQGRPSFRTLAERMHVAAPSPRLVQRRPVTYVVFDLLRLFGTDLTTQPWSARRELLERLDLTGPAWQVPPVHDDGQALHTATLEQDLEGIVSKRRSARYYPGRRSEDWLKFSHRTVHSFVVGGWKPEKEGRGLGSVLVGRADGDGGWAYAGRVGSGLAGRAAQPVIEAMRPLVRADAPFSTEVPWVEGRDATWVEPVIVIDVRVLGITESGSLRQPTYLGIRSDLRPSDLVEVHGG